MAQCTSCSAPLPVDSCRCSYCGTRNDMDFTAVNRFTFDRQPSRRQCPDCDIPLQTVRVACGGSFFAIDRCERCFGLFFDVGEVQAFLEASVSPTSEINLREIGTINQQRARSDRSFRYRKCPQCGVLMNRVNFAAMSGVVVDHCKEHGMWLDNGELIHLMEWKRAGGQLLADRRQKLEQIENRERQNQMQREAAPGASLLVGDAGGTTGDLVSTLCSLLADCFIR